MTEVSEVSDPSNADGPESGVIGEALAVIDGALQTMSSRELVSSTEVADLLLDVRMLLAASSSVRN